MHVYGRLIITTTGPGERMVVSNSPPLGRSRGCREDAIGGCVSGQHIRRRRRGDRPFQVGHHYYIYIYFKSLKLYSICLLHTIA